MSELQIELAAVYDVVLPDELDLKLRQFVWDRYHLAKDLGQMRLRVWKWILVDASSVVAARLASWFGADPLNRPV